METHIIELDEYRRRSREGLEGMKRLLRDIVAAFSEAKRPAALMRVIEQHTHDDVLCILGMCLNVEDNEVLSAEALASAKAHTTNNELSPVCCPRS